MILPYQPSPSGTNPAGQEDIYPRSINNANDLDVATFRLASHVSERPRDERPPPDNRRLEKVMCGRADSLSKPRLKVPSEVKTGGVEWGLTSRVGGLRQDIRVAPALFLGILWACGLARSPLRILRSFGCLRRTVVHISVVELVGSFVAESQLTKRLFQQSRFQITGRVNVPLTFCCRVAL